MKRRSIWYYIRNVIEGFLLLLVVGAGFWMLTHKQAQSPPPGSPSGTQQRQVTQSNDERQAARAVFAKVNAARAQAGLPALQWSDALLSSAHKHDLAMAAENQLSHQLPNEPDLGARVSQEGISWTFVAENVGVSSDTSDITATATALNQAMLAEKPPEDGHRRNILSAQAAMLGVDVFVDAQHHQVWLTEDFATT